MSVQMPYIQPQVQAKELAELTENKVEEQQPASLEVMTRAYKLTQKISGADAESDVYEQTTAELDELIDAHPDLTDFVKTLREGTESSKVPEQKDWDRVDELIRKYKDPQVVYTEQEKHKVELAALALAYVSMMSYIVEQMEKKPLIPCEDHYACDRLTQSVKDSALALLALIFMLPLALIMLAPLVAVILCGLMSYFG